MDPRHHSDNDLLSQANRRPIGDDPVDPLPPAVYPGRQPMQGPRVTLEPLDPRIHVRELFVVGNADDKAKALWAYLPYGPFASEEQMTDWMRGCAASADPVFVALRRNHDQQLMGMASFLEIRPLLGVIEIGHIWFAPPFQGTVAVTEALFLMMRHAMDDLANRRLEWKCNALNLPSRQAALRLGLRFEGVFYGHLIPKGRNRDTAWYSMLDSEWPLVKANFERWLSPDNFGEDGAQKVSLSALNRELW